MTEQNTQQFSRKQRENSMLFRWGYYFYIHFFKITDNIVYYKIFYGNSDKQLLELTVRFSELRKFGICLNKFPKRTLFNNTSSVFIRSRVDELNTWLFDVLDNDKGKDLYIALESLRVSLQKSN